MSDEWTNHIKVRAVSGVFWLVRSRASRLAVRILDRVEVVLFNYFLLDVAVEGDRNEPLPLSAKRRADIGRCDRGPLARAFCRHDVNANVSAILCRKGWIGVS
jgi:hypothetical protein